MDCRRCRHITYKGEWKGVCSLCKGSDSSASSASSPYSPEGGRKAYNTAECPHFEPAKRCRDCLKWKRGGYFKDGETPALKGGCSEGRTRQRGDECDFWVADTAANRLAMARAVGAIGAESAARPRETPGSSRYVTMATIWKL